MKSATCTGKTEGHLKLSLFQQEYESVLDTGSPNLIHTILISNQFIGNYLALGQQIAKQISGLNFLSLSNNKKYRLKNSEVFPLS